MQQLMLESHSRPPGRSRRGNTLLTLSLWAAMFGLGAAVGCGVESPAGLETPESVQSNLTPMCVTETQGDPTSCKDEKTWSAYGAMACAGKGLTLTKISYATGCGVGLYRQTTYECCSTTPTPPTPMCMWSPATGTGACRLADEWKKEGATFCAAHGLVFTDLKLDRACAAGGYATAQYECCTPTPTPTPMCSTQTLDSMTCVDDTTWKTKAEATCKAKGQSVGVVSLGAACMGGHLAIKFECCGPVTPPPPSPMCSGEAMASMTCVDDTTWKTKAEATCKAKGQTLGSVSLGTACMGGHLDVKFECCGPVTPPPTTMCTAEAVTSTTCVDDATWKTRADAACTAKKLTLRSVSYGTACMGGHKDIKFECCGPVTPPPPPPPMCTTESLAVMACVDDASWKLRADATCKAKMLTLGSLSFGAACPGGHQEVKFECCGPTTPPPPPLCTTEKGPATAVCKTPDQWKITGEAVCAAKHQSLSGLTLNGACTGGFSDAQFLCCTTPTPPPTTMCTAGVVGDGKTCAAETALKSQAEAVCTMAGMRLTAFAAYDGCAMTGGYLHAKYQCCK